MKLFKQYNFASKDKPPFPYQQHETTNAALSIDATFKIVFDGKFYSN